MLTPQQLNELNIASQRVAAGQGSDTDRANIDYATRNFGYSYTPPQSSITPPAETIVGSTNGVRDDMNLVRKDANDLMTNIRDYGSLMTQQLKNLLGSSLYTETAQGKAQKDELDRLRQSLGIFSSTEEEQIAQSGRAAYERFRPLISQAKEEKRKGMPKAVIGAGERGGFMNTQMAGVAALAPTEGGSFVGAGGELENIKSAYDANISNLESQAQAASLAAEAAARTAIRTGKRDDYAIAQDAFDKAQKSSQDAINLASEKSNAISNYLSQTKGNVEFAQSQEDRLVKQATDKINQYASMGGDFMEKSKPEILSLLTQAGYNESEIGNMFDIYKAQAEAARIDGLPTPELRTVGKNLYAVSYNKNTGQWDTKLLLGGGSGSGSGSGTSNSVKVTSTQRNKLLETFSSDDVNTITEYFNEGDKTVDDLISEYDLTDEEIIVLRSVFGVKQTQPTLDQQLNALGFSAEEKRAFKKAQEDAGQSLDPTAWLESYVDNPFANQ